MIIGIIINHKYIHNLALSPPTHLYKELIGQVDPKTLTYYQDLFSKNPKFFGVIVHCFTGIRFKIRVDEAECYISFICQGLDAPKNDPNIPEIHKLYLKAKKFAREHILQREVEVEIIHRDKKGNYFGVVKVDGINYSIQLLQEGLALLNLNPGRAPPGNIDVYEYYENFAKDNQKGIWNPNEGISIESIRSPNSKIENIEGSMKVEIVDYPSNQYFYAVLTDGSMLKKLEMKIAENFNPDDADQLKLPIRRGTHCMAFYNGKWCRGIVEYMNSEISFSVFFVDYGIIEVLSPSEMRKIESGIKDYPPNGFKLGLGYIFFPPLDTRVGTQTLRKMLKNQLNGKEILAVKKYKIGEVIYALFFDQTEKISLNSLNSLFLQYGLAKIAKNISLPLIFQEWVFLQEKACKEQLGLWESNNLEDSDEEFQS